MTTASSRPACVLYEMYGNFRGLSCCVGGSRSAFSHAGELNCTWHTFIQQIAYKASMRTQGSTRHNSFTGKQSRCRSSPGMRCWHRIAQSRCQCCKYHQCCNAHMASISGQSQHSSLKSHVNAYIPCAIAALVTTAVQGQRGASNRALHNFSSLTVIVTTAADVAQEAIRAKEPVQLAHVVALTQNSAVLINTSTHAWSKCNNSHE